MKFNLTKTSTLITLALITSLVYNPKILSESFVGRKNLELTQKAIPTDTDKQSDPFALMLEESLGELKINLPATEVIKLLGNPVEKGKSQFWDADGLYHQDWYYPEEGIIINMTAEEVNKEQIINSITLKSPSQLKTKRGITIGSSIDEVILAYSGEEDSNNPMSDEYFVAGSVYGGLIFTFENNYVSRIFLGAAAE